MDYYVLWLVIKKKRINIIFAILRRQKCQSIPVCSLSLTWFSRHDNYMYVCKRNTRLAVQYFSHDIVYAYIIRSIFPGAYISFGKVQAYHIRGKHFHFHYYYFGSRFWSVTVPLFLVIAYIFLRNQICAFSRRGN